MSIFDSHLLLGRDDWLAANKPELAHRLGLDEIRTMFAEVAPDGRWRAAACPFPSAPEQNYREENAAVLQCAAIEPRLLPVAAINPNDVESRAFLERDGGKFAGIIIWPILCKVDLRRLARDDAFWTIVKRLDLPVSIHVGTGEEPSYRDAIHANAYGPLDAIEVAEANPAIRFNLLHALRLSRSALQRAACISNVWTDLSGYSSYGSWTEGGREIFPAKDPVVGPGAYGALPKILADEFGLGDRILFGSSEPFCRWWGLTLKAEYAIYCDTAADERQDDRFSANANRFYANWIQERA
ncbi:amidohydrolase family protein [Bradyrhizobium sp. HKCCYLS3013]|uniref:amidohydrolase family protein n=1 Tax=Bradyrhizobium sp. HKCCYLS3013 TaxID=3420735 RepID=UPI003EB9A08C